MSSLTAQAALDRHFLETRCKLIEIAANLDRIDRGSDAAVARLDARLARVHEAITLLGRTDIDGADRAERLQQLFSLPYDAGWMPPNTMG